MLTSGWIGLEAIISAGLGKGIEHVAPDGVEHAVDPFLFSKAFDGADDALVEIEDGDLRGAKREYFGAG